MRKTEGYPQLFRKQQMTRGVIEKSPLADVLYEVNNSKKYVIKSASRDANGVVLAEGKVYAADTFAKACDGLMEINAKNEVVYKVCFAPGTLVHTDRGLIPIENIRVGTQVLSQAEAGGERAYRTVINTVAHLDQEVFAVQVQEDGAQTLSTLIATANHPFWVENILVENDHWLATECLEPGHLLQLADGRQASVHAAGKIRRTQHAHLGFAADDRVGVGMVLDISEKQIRLASDEQALNLGQLDLGEAFLTPVHNFEVEDFHTYYVGEVGVWVHNANCSATTTDGVRAREIALNKAEAKARLDIETCFAAGTLVHTKEGLRPIEALQVGDLVLTWPEDKPIPVRPCHPFRLEDEYIYKPVTKTFVHEDQMISHVVILGNEDETLRVTPNHPIWSKQRGWVQASVLRCGLTLKRATFSDALVGVATKHDVERVTVYNIEVEDCHTYFVGEMGIWVHNKGQDVVGIPAIRDVQAKTFIYGELSHTTDLAINTNRTTGNYTEKLAMNFMEASTGIAFKDFLRNAANNGPDMFAIIHADPARGIPGQIVVLDVKGSRFSNYQSVKDLKLDAKTRRWIEEGRNGTLNGKKISPEAKAVFERAHKLLNDPVPYEIVTGVVEVHIPSAGKTGAMTINYVPNVQKFQEVFAEGAGLSTAPLNLNDIGEVLLAARQYWLNAGASATQLDRLQINIDTLASGIAAMTVGNQVTLSTDGAGWGWFIDASPASQEEFGPGDAADEYEALSGSAAENKMDLLTVLVHEIGHTLGLDHVAGDDNLMAQFLEPGVRRLPSVADSAALIPASRPTGRVVIGTTFTRTPPLANRAAFETVAHPQLTNPTFNDASGWTTQGSVTFTNHSATLTETPTTQTRLNQVFKLGPNDRYLSFTLSGISLDDVSNAPDDDQRESLWDDQRKSPPDAFEVALIDANTGRSLLGSTGLSHNDALINLQADEQQKSQWDGTKNLASGVSTVTNADGSRHFVIDLAGIAQDTVANLSFDLIGFGRGAAASNSQLTICDLKLGVEPGSAIRKLPMSGTTNPTLT